MAQPLESSRAFSISIIGGGLAGLLLAIGLSNRGTPFKIFEAAPSFSETSAGLGFGPNSVRAMAKLDPRIYGAFMKLKTENKFEDKKNTWFDVRKGWENIPSWVTQVEMGEGGGGNVLRASFLMELVKLLPPECAMFGKTLSDIDTRSDGSFNLLFEGGTSYDADAVVGCDGIRSRVRKVLFGQGFSDSASKAVFSGTYLYRVVIEMQIASEALGEELAANSQIYMGQDCNVVTYPIEDGKLLNVIAFRRCDQEAWMHERWVVDSSEEELRSDFASMGACVQKIIKMIDKPQKWAIFDMPPVSKYSSGSITLFGDAAHASTSHAGAGAGMAVEDAFILSELLSDSKVKSIHDVPVVFSSYETIRLPRTQKLVQHSRESGYLYQLRKPGLGDDIEKIKETLGSWQNWIWDIDLESHLEEGRRELRAMLDNCES